MIKKIIIDTSPIIFLSKIGYIEIINNLFPSKISILKSVIHELFNHVIPPDEKIEIENFIKNNNSIDYSKTSINSSTLSSTDNMIITYAIQKKLQLIITDDNFIRKVARNQNIYSIGTLGMLIKCVEKKILKSDIAIKLINDLIDKYDLRISLDVYKDIIDNLKNLK